MLALSTGWVGKEFEGINLGDKRLSRRFFLLMGRFVTHIGHSLAQAVGDSAAAKAACRFFANEKVEMAPILEPHLNMLVKRARLAKGPILNIQDTSGLNYFKHPSKTDQGHIGTSAKRVDTTGYWLHTAMATNAEGVPLGLTYQEIWARQETHKGEPDSERKSRTRRLPLADKESGRWVDALEGSRALIAANLDVIQIGDREADIFEFMQKSQEIGSSFIVRSKSDRSIEVKTPSGRATIKSLHSYAKSAPVAASTEIVIQGNSQRPDLKVTVSIRKQEVTILVPKSNRTMEEAATLTPISASVVVVTSRARVDGKPLCWILLTDRETQTPKNLENVIRWYRLRWQIEIFHKTLKSGCKIEDCRLSNLEKIAPYVLMKSIAATKVMELTYASRHTPEASARDYFSSEQWQVLKVVLYKKGEIPRRPKIGDLATKVAIRGGFLPGKKRQPGIVTMWRGWEALQYGLDLLEDLKRSGFKTCG